MRNILIACALLGAVFSFTGQAMAQAPGPRLTPAETKRAWYENRRILIEVSTDSAFDPVKKGLRPNAPATFPFGEHFGNRIGGIVPLRIRVYARHPEGKDQQRIQINWTALQNGRFSIDPMEDPDFVLANPAVLPAGEVPGTIEGPKQVTLEIGDKRYEADLYELRLYVQTFRMPQPMVFNLEFSYAAQALGDNGLDWKRITTPDYVISMSKTADDGPDLSSGNTALAEQKPPFAIGIFLLALGVVWVATPLAFIVLRFARSRFVSVKQLDREERAWLQMGPVFARCKSEKGYKFAEADVRIVVNAVLEFIGFPALRSDELEKLRYEDDDGPLLISMLRPLMEGVLEQGETLSEERSLELVERIESLIKRP